MSTPEYLKRKKKTSYRDEQQTKTSGMVGGIAVYKCGKCGASIALVAEENHIKACSGNKKSNGDIAPFVYD